MNTTHTIPLAGLTAAMHRVMQGFGSQPAEAHAVAHNLIDANLSGHDSHGIGMLPRYAAAFLEGGLKANVQPRVLHDGGSMLRLDGGSGFGQVIGAQAMALGIERARVHGSCVLAVGNAHHLGRIGAWAEQAAAAGLVSVHFVNVIARPIVAPHGGGDARFGTNPFCAGVPLPGQEPVILDFATSVIAQGKTRVAHNKGETVEPGCLIDDQGHPTTQPRFTVMPPFGALLPVGGDLSGHKGYGLALMCELLGGALAAGHTLAGEQAPQARVLNGMLSVLIDPAALGGAEVFAQQARAFLDWVKASPPRAGFGPVQVAGDAERVMRAQRREHGVPVDGTTWQEILDGARSLGVDPQEVQALAFRR
jgi:hydroxycarboxylate dehydrogenase B